MPDYGTGYNLGAGGAPSGTELGIMGGIALGGLATIGFAFAGLPLLAVGIVSLVDLYPELEGMDANGAFERFLIDLDSF
jgi:hypothetical protein